MSRWRELWNDLLGRGEERLREPLRHQMVVGVAMTDLFLEAIAAGTLNDVDVDRVNELEAEADEALDDVLNRVSRTLQTPIDREDLFRFSRSLDDIVNNLRDFGLEVASYGVGNQHRFDVPLRALRSGCESLTSAIEQLSSEPDELARAARDVKHANSARHAFHDEMAKLLRENLTMDTIRDRELLRRLDVAGLRLGEAADALASGALKRG